MGAGRLRLEPGTVREPRLREAPVPPLPLCARIKAPPSAWVAPGLPLQGHWRCSAPGEGPALPCAELCESSRCRWEERSGAGRRQGPPGWGHQCKMLHRSGGLVPSPSCTCVISPLFPSSPVSPQGTEHMEPLLSFGKLTSLEKRRIKSLGTRRRCAWLATVTFPSCHGDPMPSLRQQSKKKREREREMIRAISVGFFGFVWLLFLTLSLQAMADARSSPS